MEDEYATATAVQSAWADAFEKRDLDRLISLYSPQTAFWGSTNDLHTDPEGVRRYFTNLPPSYKRSLYARPHVLRLNEDVIVASVNVVFIREIDGKDVELPYRMTHVLVRQKGVWKIATHHASPQVA
ncbi:nuclear transport factor 2 family protein [Bradyrhizobium sp. PRIMUS42]|uniref:YybH family protein n=1 Tax=Bradyrhizobium sp. PRIMUS42 TaxID=2908926 RepID=UPI001FF150B4|nr:nuclear transport factor 2 family protein [Bradyrhizobium sp. PRIMUS42]MCJ9728677.1 nuclear transport factor 2 family protein [Bradyrhizobium sp. PRIMUS42]